ncbi:MAG TPA: UDP-3-O-(3-hydroxymyristoyl)glucosamine N-acyltransferase [Stellaceae bacterium]|nr:UDP-3-O-(3-hydroxymyristoyl)glucosamine N-acyltransferase [Stellaceae bacterium]
MADLRFFRLTGPFTLGEIARRSGATPAAGADATRVLRDVAPLDQAEAQHLSFLDNRKYLPAFRATRAGACIVHPDLAAEAPKSTALLLTPDPYRAYALAAQAFYPDPPPEPGVHPTSVIDATARLGAGCRVEAGVVVGARAELGARCHIGPNAVIGDSCILGDDVRIGANASLSHCIVGARVRLYPGARIGQDGFGFAPDRTGFVKVPQLGRVIIGDDVEVGANSTIDRGAGPDTVIGAGTMIDNLVQIGHNVQTGRRCVIVANAAISGSTRLGDFVMIGGQAGFAGHLNIGSGAKIGAQAGVIRDVADAETLIGSPAQPVKEFWRQVVALQRLAKQRKE